MAYPTDPVVVFGIWTAAILTILLYTYVLYKESPLFRFAEHTFVATATALAIITMVQTIQSKTIAGIVAGNPLFVVLFILGILLYTRFIPGYAYISRWPLAIIIGVGMGVVVRGAITADVVASINATVLPLAPPLAKDPLTIFNNFIVFIGVVTSLAYFTFTREHRGALKPVATVGRYFVMAMIGSYLGNIIMARFSLLIDRIDFILRVFGIIPY